MVKKKAARARPTKVAAKAKTERIDRPVKTDSGVPAAVAYLLGLITGVIFYFAMPEDKYVRFHAVQSILFSILLLAIWIIIWAITWPLLFIPLVGWAILGLIWAIYWIVGVFSWLYLMYAALTGKQYKYPVIGKYAEDHCC